ncbi:hypothetical protein GQ53DRAFT_134970 [Thozetella sp. PMI_491]|nr:hypothetical protein GQ53DRAFT_134970 [Thozetella sp. PMI_491]
MDRSAPVRKPCCYPPNLSRAKNESEDDPPSSQRAANRLADGVDQSSRVDAEPLWPICFTQGQDFNFHTFNQPCVDLLRQQWLDNNELSDDGQATGKDDEGSDEGSDDESDDGSDDDSCGDSDSEGDDLDDLSRVRMFMRQDNEHHGTYRGQVSVVESFCAQIDVNDFEVGGAAGETERNALLDERTEIGEARMDRGPMDSLQLFNALSQKRFTGGISTATSQGMACTETGHSEPNAARRTLYITNLNPHGAAALCMTTSLHEAPMVRDLLHEHLIRSTEVGVLLPAHGYPTFTIKIHLSFYTLTKRPKTRFA